MGVRLKQYWFNIQSSLWFLPTIMALASVVLAFAFLELDSSITYKDFPIAWFIYGGQPDGARSVLSTIASSMVTIAGVTFSITLVALTMASSQFGPRLLRNFISDKGNQFVIGTFISTFIYSLIVLLTIRGSDDDEFIPKISVVFAFLLAILSLGVLIFFIHHVSTSIQADYIINSSYKDFRKVTDNYLLNEGDSVENIDISASLKQVKAEYLLSTEVHCDKSGFIQSVDYEGACKWAEKNNAAIEWLIYPGSFVTIHHVFAIVYHQSLQPLQTEKQIQDFIVTRYQRTPNQDLLFSLKQIVEVGVRALSPGINDPHTAITCIQWIGAALSELSTKKFGNPFLRDSSANIKVIKKQITYQDIADTSFDQLCLYGKSNIYVIETLLDAIKKPLEIPINKEFESVLKAKATDIYRETIHQLNDNQKLSIEKSYYEIMQLP
ncbi:MAG: DUF2254 domain-containing protein [Ginsengibacter sp.]